MACPLFFAPHSLEITYSEFHQHRSVDVLYIMFVHMYVCIMFTRVLLIQMHLRPFSPFVFPPLFFIFGERFCSCKGKARQCCKNVRKPDTRICNHFCKGKWGEKGGTSESFRRLKIVASKSAQNKYASKTFSS